MGLDGTFGASNLTENKKEHFIIYSESFDNLVWIF